MSRRNLKTFLPLAFSLIALSACSVSLSSGLSSLGGQSGDSSAGAASVESTSSGGGTVTSVSASVDSTPTSSPSSSTVPVSSNGTISLAEGASTTDAASGVAIDNSANQILITSLGAYVLTGTLSEGNIRISVDAVDDANDAVELILNGVSISKTNAKNNCAPIGSIGSAHLKITKYDGSVNYVKDARTLASYTGDDTGAIFANKKLKVVGSGKLTVVATYNNGISSDSSLIAHNGSLIVSASNNGVKAHNKVILGDKSDGGSFSITSTAGDAVKVDEVDSDVTGVVLNQEDSDGDSLAGVEIKDGDYALSGADDGIDSAANIYVEAGTGTLQATDKGIVADLDVNLNGGAYAVTSGDDCIHSSAQNLYANAGSWSLTTGTADGCQGLKAELAVDIKGGTYQINSSDEGIGGHKIVMSGGTTIINASDDGWSAGGTSTAADPCLIDISGGFNYIYAGGDGLDSNGNIVVSGGTTVVCAPDTGGNGPLDYGDGRGWSCRQSGGILIAYGVSGMAVGSSGTQNSILLKSHASLGKGSYYVFLVNGSYYAVKAQRTSTTVYASFPGYGANAYGIYSASSVSGESAVFETGYLYAVSSYTSSSVLSSGTFSASTNSHISSGSGGGGGGF